jgi:hypothetical protein
VPNSFNSSCESGFTGDLCNEDIDDCLVNTCLNNATCSDDGSIPNSFNCSCDSGFTGDLCSEDIDDCSSNPCDPIGTSNCFDLGANLFECKCIESYSGTYCEIQDSACISNPCENNGICIDDSTTTGFSCNCTENYSGIACNDTIIFVSYWVRVEFTTEDTDVIEAVLISSITEEYGLTIDDFDLTILERDTDAGFVTFEIVFMSGKVDDITREDIEALTASSGLYPIGIGIYEEPPAETAGSPSVLRDGINHSNLLLSLCCLIIVSIIR